MHLKDVLAQGFPDSLITEFNKVFGDEATRKFIDIFGGTEFSVPKWSQVRRMEKLLSKEADESQDV